MINLFHVQFVTSAGVTGDYNNNGVVDAADYVLWRENLNSSNTLPIDSTPGMVTQVDYDVWRTNFGRTSGAGSALLDPATSAVPEPGSVSMLSVVALHLRRCQGLCLSC